MSKEKISIPEVALATIAKEDSALQLACSGELSLAEIDQEYLVKYCVMDTSHKETRAGRVVARKSSDYCRRAFRF